LERESALSYRGLGLQCVGKGAGTIAVVRARYRQEAQALEDAGAGAWILDDGVHQQQRVHHEPIVRVHQVLEEALATQVDPIVGVTPTLSCDSQLERTSTDLHTYVERSAAGSSWSSCCSLSFVPSDDVDAFGGNGSASVLAEMLKCSQEPSSLEDGSAEAVVEVEVVDSTDPLLTRLAGPRATLE